MIIQVTERDIQKARLLRKKKTRHARKTDGHVCPVALAVRRIVGDDAYVYVGPTYVMVGATEMELPPVATSSTRAFDAGRSLGPFTFNLRRP